VKIIGQEAPQAVGEEMGNWRGRGSGGAGFQNGLKEKGREILPSAGGGKDEKISTGWQNKSRKDGQGQLGERGLSVSRTI